MSIIRESVFSDNREVDAAQNIHFDYGPSVLCALQKEWGF